MQGGTEVTFDSRDCEVTAGGGVAGGRLLLFDTLPSTNRWAMANLVACGHGDVVRAVRQPDGKGRFERPWVCPANRGLAVSIVLKGLADWPATNIGRIGALAICDALATFSVVAEVKWPNDVMIGARKVAGLLAEREPSSGEVVLGIGLNVNTTSSDFESAGLAAIATSVCAAKGAAVDVSVVCSAVIGSFSIILDRIDAEGVEWFQSEWETRDFLSDAVVRVCGLNGDVSGRCCGVDAEGRLMVQDASGTVQTYWTGDVERIVVGTG